MYVTLFLSSFLAATIFPAQSETLLAYQISQ
ncbi:MAG: DedA family protein, partial [Rhodobacteraceae bacterium]|nr:DedA family protein [Paracoccaceae bacterium]